MFWETKHFVTLQTGLCWWPCCTKAQASPGNSQSRAAPPGGTSWEPRVTPARVTPAGQCPRPPQHSPAGDEPDQRSRVLQTSPSAAPGTAHAEPGPEAAQGAPAGGSSGPGRGWRPPVTQWLRRRLTAPSWSEMEVPQPWAEAPGEAGPLRHTGHSGPEKATGFPGAGAGQRGTLTAF